MLTEIYYFSGTGNSLAVARDLSGKLKASLIPIAAILSEDSIPIDPDVAGIVFPVYHSGLPFILREFIEKDPVPKATPMSFAFVPTEPPARAQPFDTFERPCAPAVESFQPVSR